jgi:hypothetical protein
MKTFNFSKNWNRKLYNDYFTTIRFFDKQIKVGDEVEIKLKDNSFGIAKVEKVQKFLIDQLPEITAFLDTGTNRKNTIEILRRMYLKYNPDWSKEPLTIFLVKYSKRKPISQPWRITKS